MVVFPVLDRGILRVVTRTLGLPAAKLKENMEDILTINEPETRPSGTSICSAVRRFRKKPVEIEAVQWLGDNFVKVDRFVTCNHVTNPREGRVAIETLEGTMLARIGDWIIRGVNGEFYPCKPDIFAKTYEDAEQTSECHLGTVMPFVCDQIPEDWLLRIDLMEGEADIELQDPDGNVVELCDDDKTPEQMIADRVRYARNSDGLTDGGNHEDGL